MAEVKRTRKSANHHLGIYNVKTIEEKETNRKKQEKEKKREKQVYGNEI